MGGWVVYWAHGTAWVDDDEISFIIGSYLLLGKIVFAWSFGFQKDADVVEKLNESGDLRRILRRYKVCAFN